MGQRLILAAVLYVAIAMIGAFIAITQKIPYQFGGQGDPNTVGWDFVRGSGTAMSPPLGALAVVLLSVLLVARRGWVGKVGAAVLVLLGLMFVIGALGEPLTFDSLNPADPDPWKGLIQWLEIAMAAFVVYYGVRVIVEREGGRERVREGGKREG